MPTLDMDLLERQHGANHSSGFAVPLCYLRWDNPNTQPSTTAQYDILLWTNTAFSWTFGLAMIFGIVHYERFGGDPQKRSLGNRLISCGVKSLASQTFFLQILLISVR